jgi:hypothetical protein
LNPPSDDGSVVGGTRFALASRMAKQSSIESRVQVIEKKVAKLEQLSKGWDASLEKRFRAEGEMMDERFANLYAYIDKRFIGVDKQFAGVDQRFDSIDRELKILREGMKIILARLPNPDG